MTEKLKTELSRRTFVKGTAAAAALAAVGSGIIGSIKPTIADGADSADGKETWVTTACRECREHDPIRVKVVNDVVVKIQGIPDHPDTLGKICGRGAAGIMNLYNPYRVKTPMKRTNPEKGWGVDPKWVEITWDEALNTVAAKIKEVAAKDPREFAMFSGFGTVTRGMFNRILGTTNDLGWGQGEFCGGGEHLAWARVVGDDTMGTDMEYCNYYLIFGTNARGLGKGLPYTVRGFTAARRRGMKVVVVDPVQAFDARKADEWVPILPGTDQAFCMAMCYAMVFEYDLVDWEHMELRTNAPYLIDSSGWYVRSKDQTFRDPNRNETNGKPLVWDEVDKKAKPFDDPTIKKFALKGSYEVDGVKCRPAWELFLEYLKPATPEWAAKICGTTPEIIRHVAKEFGEYSQIGATKTFFDHKDGPYTIPYRPVGVGFGKGSQGHYHATLNSRGISLLYVITGAANVVGSTKGSNGTTQPLEPDLDGTIKWTGSRFLGYRFTYPPQRVDQYDMHPLAHTGGSHIAHSILHPESVDLEYKIRAAGINFQNPFRNMANGELTADAINKLEFFFSIAYHFDEPTEMADIVMPEPSFLERWEMFSGSGARYTFEEYKEIADDSSWIRQPCVTRLHNVMDSNDIIYELARRAGYQKQLNAAINTQFRLNDANKLGENDKAEWKDVMDRNLKTKWGQEFGLEWFRKNLTKGVPGTRKRWYPYTYFKNPPRQSLYDEYIKWCGERFKKDLAAKGVTIKKEAYEEFTPFPEWKGLGPIGNAPAEFDLYAVNFGVCLMVMGMGMDNAWKHEYNRLFEPYQMGVWINPVTAAKHGIKSGDLIEIESQFGFKTKGEAVVTEGVMPECIGIPGNYGNRSVNLPDFSREGAHHNTLMSAAEEHLCPISGNVEGSPRVKIKKIN